jgi:hypothetical protein
MKKKMYLLFALCIMNIILFAPATFAVELKEGVYEIEASLSCHVNAMGGIEFGKPLLEKAIVSVNSTGKRTMTLELTKSSITIHGVTCDIFVDATPTTSVDDRGIKSGTIGYYDKNDALQTDGVKHVLSNDTALNTKGQEVQYVDTISFPLDDEVEFDRKTTEYNLTLYVNSNVMGVQFGNKNDQATTATYPAILTVNWDNINGQGGLSNEPVKSAAPANSAEIIEDDGLNIHYANGENDNQKAVSEVTYTAYLNIGWLIFIGICAIILIAIGTVLLISAKRTREEKLQNEEN